MMTGYSNQPIPKEAANHLAGSLPHLRAVTAL